MYLDKKDKNEEIDLDFGGLEDRTYVCSKNNVLSQNKLAAVKQTDVGGCEDDDYDIGF
jgi:hypothetical protein